MTDEKAKVLMEKFFEQEAEWEKLWEEYFDIVEVVLSTKKAAMFIMLEYRVDMGYKLKVARRLPLIE
jgi:hypothetical protein